jgi:hypothetical protein
MDRASASGAEGRRFESSQARQVFITLQGKKEFFLKQPVLVDSEIYFDYYIFLLITDNQSLISFINGPLAQLVEQLTLNQRVGGSNPPRFTIIYKGFQG